MRNVTDRESNPFGMDPPCPGASGEGPDAVFGYGDANADVHVVGDHPGVHGGCHGDGAVSADGDAIPFTGAEAGERVLAVLKAVGLASERADDGPALSNCFLSYLYPCCLGPGEEPTDAGYAELEPFFDAELRAIGAHVLVPVGQRPTRHVLREYTAADPCQSVEDLHAGQIYGSGFLVVPLADPGDWSDDEFARAVESLSDLLATDYAQEADLGRFTAGGDPYFVR